MNGGCALVASAVEVAHRTEITYDIWWRSLTKQDT
jgi:hypothetical protein